MTIWTLDWLSNRIRFDCTGIWLFHNGGDQSVDVQTKQIHNAERTNENINSERSPKLNADGSFNQQLLFNSNIKESSNAQCLLVLCGVKLALEFVSQ